MFRTVFKCSLQSVHFDSILSRLSASLQTLRRCAAHWRLLPPSPFECRSLWRTEQNSMKTEHMNSKVLFFVNQINYRCNRLNQWNWWADSWLNNQAAHWAEIFVLFDGSILKKSSLITSSKLFSRTGSLKSMRFFLRALNSAWNSFSLISSSAVTLSAVIRWILMKHQLKPLPRFVSSRYSWRAARSGRWKIILFSSW